MKIKINKNWEIEFYNIPVIHFNLSVFSIILKLEKMYEIKDFTFKIEMDEFMPVGKLNRKILILENVVLN